MLVIEYQNISKPAWAKDLPKLSASPTSFDWLFGDWVIFSDGFPLNLLFLYSLIFSTWACGKWTRLLWMGSLFTPSGFCFLQTSGLSFLSIFVILVLLVNFHYSSGTVAVDASNSWKGISLWTFSYFEIFGAQSPCFGLDQVKWHELLFWCDECFHNTLDHSKRYVSNLGNYWNDNVQSEDQRFWGPLNLEVGTRWRMGATWEKAQHSTSMRSDLWKDAAAFSSNGRR